MKNIQDLPEMLNVKDIQEFLGIAKGTAYDLIKREKFPSLQVSKSRYVIPKHAFFKWIEKETGYYIGDDSDGN